MGAVAAGNLTSSVNKDRRAGPMSGLLLLDVYVDSPALIENEFTRTRARNFSCPLFSNGPAGSS